VSAVISDHDSSDSDSGATRKIGDRLFDEDDGPSNKITARNLRDYAKDMDPKLLKQMIAQDSPELNPMLLELQETMDTIETQLKPVLVKVKSSGGHGFLASKNGRHYLEMKYNLLLSYSTFLVFYLMLKVEGRDVKNHPVIYKLAHIKTLFEKLKPLDEKMKVEIDRVLSKEADEDSSQLDEEDELDLEEGDVVDKARDDSSDEDMASDEYDDEAMPSDDEEFGDDLTAAQVKELSNVVRMNLEK